jgi:hypothetical protein
MSEFPISSRLREIASDLRMNAREHGRAQSPVAVVLMRKMEDIVSRLNEVITELEQPIEGTHAFDLVRDMEKANVETTETLIHMVAATVLSKLIEEEGGGRANITFGPLDMDAMYRDYEMAATHDGLLTTVRIKPREDKLVTHEFHDPKPPVSLMAQTVDPSLVPASPQAVAVPHDRPLWVISYYNEDGEGPFVKRMQDQATATRLLNTFHYNDSVPFPVIENRFCLHPDCPAEHCNHVEVTSANGVPERVVLDNRNGTMDLPSSDD